MNTLIGFVCLLTLLGLCLAGLFSRQYDDNLAHCVGMVVIGLWALAQLLRLWRTQVMPPDDLWLCVGLVCFGTGTAVRTWLYNRKGG